MSVAIQVSSETYQLLERRAREMATTPEKVAETAIFQQFGGMVHIHLRQTRNGLHPYIYGTRVAVRHVVEFLNAGHSVEEIIADDLPRISPAAIFEAIAYYYDHRAEIDAEIAANSPTAIQAQFEQRLTTDQIAALRGQSA
ncbi:MAG: DUF433 domain-containing protein [Caldilineaceae bacterium]